MTRSVGANHRAAARTLAKLRRQERLDEVGELLGVLLRTSAELVDAATGPDSDMAGYARAQVVRVHAGVIGQLADMVGGAESDAFEALVASMSVPTPGSTTPGRFE